MNDYLLDKIESEKVVLLTYGLNLSFCAVNTNCERS